MSLSNKVAIQISLDDFQFILQQDAEKYLRAMQIVKCKQCGGQKRNLNDEPTFWLSDQCDIIIDGYASPCGHQNRRRIITKDRIDRQEYAMTIRELRMDVLGIYNARPEDED